MDKIELIFNIYKDSVVVSKPFKLEVQKKYKLSDDEVRNLYIRIQNYQVEKFGERLSYREQSFTSQEKDIVNRRATQRRYSKRVGHQKNDLLKNYFGDVIGEIDGLIKEARMLR